MTFSLHERQPPLKSSKQAAIAFSIHLLRKLRSC
jgi:hypothetical protein